MLRFLFSSAFLLTASLVAAPANPSTSKGSATKKQETFKPFTGKISGTKVRLRAKPDLDSQIVRQMNKNDLLLVVGEMHDFYAIEPPKETKAYVFRSYVLDNVVEANRVNVRLEPHVDAIIIGQLQAGDKIVGHPCPMNPKWLEITPPKNTCFYVAKDLISNVGGPEYLANMELRKTQVETLLLKACVDAEKELKKGFPEIAQQPVLDQFQLILRSFSDFPQATIKAKEALASFKESYLNKKIEFLEGRSELSDLEKKEMLAHHRAEQKELLQNSEKIAVQNKAPSEKVSHWSTLEDSLYASWAAFHRNKDMRDFYTEQRANGIVLTGRVDVYTTEVQDKPGNFILKGRNAPIAYLYSTQVDLGQYLGKTISILASPRPNHHFAFPAYYVLGIE